LRENAERAKRRRVFVYDRETQETKGVVSLAEVQEGVLATAKIELAVDEETRPKKQVCVLCARVFAVNPMGKVARLCGECPCDRCGGAVGYKTTSEAAKEGRRPFCRKCTHVICRAQRTPEEEKKRISRWRSSYTPEKRSAAARKRADRQTREQRSEIGKRNWEKKTPAQKAEHARKAAEYGRRAHKQASS